MACVRADDVMQSRPKLADRVEEGHLLSRGCDLGHAPACDRFRDYISSGGKVELDASCKENDYTSCFISGLVDMFGISTSIDASMAMESWEWACDGGWARACGYLGETYLLGKNTAEDPEAAAHYLEKACSTDYPSACTTLATMYQRGHGVPQDEARAEQLLRGACDAGWQLACDRL